MHRRPSAAGAWLSPSLDRAVSRWFRFRVCVGIRIGLSVGDRMRDRVGAQACVARRNCGRRDSPQLLVGSPSALPRGVGKRLTRQIPTRGEEDRAESEWFGGGSR